MNSLSLSTSNSLFHSLVPQPNRTSQIHFTVSCRATTKLKEQGNLYKVLSLSPGNSTTKDEIKRAYRSMALQYHPDVCHDDSIKEESTKMFVLVNEAYKTLSNPMLRAQYDFELGLGCEIRVCDDDQRWNWKSCWEEEEQGVELKTRSRRDRRMGQKSGSCGNRMRGATHMRHRN